MRRVRGQLAARVNAVPSPRTFDPQRTLLLTGSPRSGTTWMGQVFSASHEYCLVPEPLHLKMPGLREAGFSWRTYVEPDAEWPEGRAVFERLFRGKGVTLKLLRWNRISLLTARSLVIKAVRANRLLPWLARHFAIRGMVYVIRHPCAVVSSQMAHPYMGSGDRLAVHDREYLERKLPDLLPFARGLKTEEERRALTWALDQHAPLSAPDSAAGRLLVSYEQLVANGEDELRRVFSAIGGVVPPAALAGLRENSSQVQSFSVDHARASVEDRLAVWKRRLSSEQVERILAVVEACGLRGFGEDLVPVVEAIGCDAPRVQQA